MDELTQDVPQSLDSEAMEVKAAGEDAVDTSASFNGRLNLSTFAFSPPTVPEPMSPATRARGRPRIDRGDSAVPTTSSNKRKSSSNSSSTALSSSPTKRTRTPSGYAPPSKYAHLPPLADTIGPNLILLFVGLNPGVETARSGNPYAHPSNLFWKLLHSSRITPRRYAPSEHRKLPSELSLGNTNIVSRPTKNGAELSKAEMDESVAALESKIATFRPEVVCIVGKSIWESVWRVKKGKAMKKDEFKYGWQLEKENMGVVQKGSEDEVWAGAKVFVSTSTSGLAASMSLAEKQKIWNELGDWVVQRRKEKQVVRDVSV